MTIIRKEIRLSKEVVDYLYKLIPKDKKRQFQNNAGGKYERK